MPHPAFVRCTHSLAALACFAAPLTAQVSFTNKIDELGGQLTNYGRSVATIDLDGDGLLDIVASNDAQPVKYFKHLPDHTFLNAKNLWTPPQDTAGHRGTLAADFDGDGDPDVYVTNGLPAADNQMVRNDISIGGGLVDITSSTGDGGLSGGNSFAGCALDYDRDGMLDVFVANWDGSVCDLLRNEGGMQFTEVSDEAGITQVGDYRNCGAADFDNDGWQDIAASNWTGANRLYRNEQDGTFTNVAAYSNVDLPGRNFGMVFSDFDNDGWLDLFVAKWNPSLPGVPSVVLLRDPGGVFFEAGELGANTAMGHNVADFDNDGFQEVYIGTGAPAFDDFDVLFTTRPDGAGGLVIEDITSASQLDSVGLTRCHGLGVFDLEGDGDLDVYSNMGGPGNLPDTIEENAFWVNDGTPNAWSALDLRGIFSNRSAVGAKAVAVTTDGVEVHRLLSVGFGFANTNSPTLHFGLGQASGLARYRVTWPSGVEQIVLNPPMGQRLALVETGLRSEGVPSPGAVMRLEACGPEGARIDYYLSFGTAEVEVPFLAGMLLLAPPQLFLAAQVLDGEGLAAFELGIPDTPAIVGLSGHFQGALRDLSGNFIGTTNRVSITPQ